jgi:hypothetical protein
MATPTTKAELISYCERQLGAPVLQINMDDAQKDDIIDQALQYYHEYHYDGIEKMFLKHKFTESEVTRFNEGDASSTSPDGSEWESRNNYIEVPELVLGIQKVFGVSSNFLRNNLFGMSNQYYLMDLFSFSSGSAFSFGNFDLTNYYMIKQHFETIDMVINTGSLIQYRFNKRQDRLYLDIDKSRIREDQYLIIECYRYLDPTNFTQVFNDSFLKRYATALMKRQWGQNLIKYNNVQLPGGITLNGRQIWEDGDREVRELESRMMTDYSLPPLDIIG